jgi:hypothetical protein
MTTAPRPSLFTIADAWTAFPTDQYRAYGIDLANDASRHALVTEVDAYDRASNAAFRLYCRKISRQVHRTPAGVLVNDYGQQVEEL